MYNCKLRKAYIFFFSILQTFALIASDKFPQVHVKQGILEGKTYELEGGRTYSSFKGVPYAKPPVEGLRFKVAQPPLPWEGVRTAHEYGSMCIQHILDTKIVTGDEDCLFVNIFTPNFSKNKRDNRLLPVMVFIHGGSYLFGSSDLYGPEPLMYQDVVLVTFNYRMAVLGFLCLDIPEVPGNAALKDHVLCLKWVRDNIAKFNGDPDNVTIFGQSAGSHAVSLHCISPMSKGLFHRAITQSAMFTNDWSFTIDNVKQAFLLGKALGNNTNNPYELLEFLQNLPVDEILGIKFPLITRDIFKIDLLHPYIPVVENVPTQDTFLGAHPLEILKKSDAVTVPIIAGFASADGDVLLRDVDQTIEDHTKFQELNVPTKIAWDVPLKMVYNLGSKVHEFYFGKDGVTVEKFVDLKTDLFTAYDTYKLSKIIASRFPTKVYFYIFDMRSERNIIEEFLGFPSVETGVAHGTDVFYLFGSDFLDPLDTSSNTFLLVNNFTTLWTNFARTGDPTPTDALGVRWLPFTAEKENYLYIGNQLISRSYPERKRFAFWESVDDEVKSYIPN